MAPLSLYLENPITNVFIWYHKRALGHYRYSIPPFNYFMHSIFKILRPGSSPYRHQTFFGSFVLWPKLEWIQAPFSSIFDGNILLKIYCFRLTNQQINKSFPWDGIVSRSGCALRLILYYVYIFYFVHSLRCWFFFLFCFLVYMHPERYQAGGWMEYQQWCLWLPYLDNDRLRARRLDPNPGYHQIFDPLASELTAVGGWVSSKPRQKIRRKQ